MSGLFDTFAGGAASKYSIGHSLRFRASASAYLGRTFGSPANQAKWTWSGWAKKGQLSTGMQLLMAGAGANYSYILLESDNTIVFSNVIASASASAKKTRAVYRDPCAHFHLVCIYDSNNAVAGDRIQIWVNGARVTEFSSSTDPALGSVAQINANAVTHYIGRNSTVVAELFDGYLAEVHVIDGQALTPSSFGETNADGVWVPKKYAGTYGANGFYLDFSDGSSLAALTADKSGNGNNWTANNISLTAGVTYDWMTDTPTNNYATLNPLIASAANISYANLRSGTTAVQATQDAASFTVSGAYWEVTAAGSTVTAGVISGTGTTNTTSVTANKVFGFRLTNAGALSYINITDAGSWTSITTGLTGQQYPYGTIQAADWNFGQRPFIGTPSGQALCTANLPAVMIANPRKHFGVLSHVGNGTSITVTGAQFSPDFVWVKNRSFANSHGLYDVLRGVERYLTSNDTIAESIQPQHLTSFNSDGYTFGSGAVGNTLNDAYVDWLWKANGAGVTNLATYSQDFSNGVWFTSNVSLTHGQTDPFGTSTATLITSTSGYCVLYRTSGLTITANSTNTISLYVKAGTSSSLMVRLANSALTNQVNCAFNLSIGTAGTIAYAGSGSGGSATIAAIGSGWYRVSLSGIIDASTTAARVDFQLQTASTNLTVAFAQFQSGSAVSTYIPSGSIAPTVSANTTAGFSIVTYTGNETKDATVGHGLGVVPKMIISKGRSLGGYDWPVHHDFVATGYSLILNGTGAQQNTYPYFNAKDPTSAVFYLPGNADANRYTQNKSGETYVAYCFAEIPGYSKFGSVTCNASTDNAFVFTGISGGLLLIKCISTTGNWVMLDTTRKTYNVEGPVLLSNSSGAESTQTYLDFTAGGFKIRSSGADVGAAQTYIYAHIGGTPFGGSNVSPSPAR